MDDSLKIRITSEENSEINRGEILVTVPEGILGGNPTSEQTTYTDISGRMS